MQSRYYQYSQTTFSSSFQQLPPAAPTLPQNANSLYECSDRATRMIPHSQFLILALPICAQSKWTTEYVRFVRILIDGVTSSSGKSEHQFWDNPCNQKSRQNLNEIKRDFSRNLRTFLEKIFSFTYQIMEYFVHVVSKLTCKPRRPVDILVRSLSPFPFSFLTSWLQTEIPKG